jgi:acetyl-CoA carboxylase biotin carboxyl carrier protein
MEPVVNETPTPSAGPFDVRTIHRLIRLMSKNDLTQIDLRDGAQRIMLRRGPAGGPVLAAAPVLPPVLPPVPLPSAAAAPATSSPVARQLLEIKSPTPGTFYAAAGPDAQAFVQVGSRVQPDTIVCIIEAMKVFNEIPAECAGTIAEICVQNQQSVEYGQVLFRVDPSA